MSQLVFPIHRNPEEVGFNTSEGMVARPQLILPQNTLWACSEVCLPGDSMSSQAENKSNHHESSADVYEGSSKKDIHAECEEIKPGMANQVQGANILLLTPQIRAWGKVGPATSTSPYLDPGKIHVHYLLLVDIHGLEKKLPGTFRIKDASTNGPWNGPCKTFLFKQKHL